MVYCCAHILDFISIQNLRLFIYLQTFGLKVLSVAVTVSPYRHTWDFLFHSIGAVLLPLLLLLRVTDYDEGAAAGELLEVSAVADAAFGSGWPTGLRPRSFIHHGPPTT